MERSWPQVIYKEEVMREGMQIESSDIPVADKVQLLDELGETGLTNIVVGSFVRPEYTPQMAQIEEVLRKFTPKDGVTYTALLLNSRAAERARDFSPPLTLDHEPPRLAAHLCDVFARRNINRSAAQVADSWPATVARAAERGVVEAGIGAHAAWGSNFSGGRDVTEVIAALEDAERLWSAAGIAVTSVYLGDPMSWNTPHQTEALLTAVKARFPQVHRFVLHLHDARGMALVSAYAALRTLGPDDAVQLEGTLGGIGGCPYCGNGRATGMMATEDVMHMLDGMGIAHGVDLDRLIRCEWLLERMVGRPTMGHVSKAGPRPVAPDAWYDPNMPFVETFTQARHFALGPDVYRDGLYPWKERIPPSPRSSSGDCP
jgi:hydroxymethylglutaryl-CoA lyase